MRDALKWLHGVAAGTQAPLPRGVARDRVVRAAELWANDNVEKLRTAAAPAAANPSTGPINPATGPAVAAGSAAAAAGSAAATGPATAVGPAAGDPAVLGDSYAVGDRVGAGAGAGAGVRIGVGVGGCENVVV